MNLRNLTDSELLASTDKAVHQEREALTTVLHHLLEVDRRRLYSSLQCASLFEFAMKRFKYTEDQAARRIAAMKVLRELPEIEKKISQGDLTLTHISLARSHFRQEKKIQNKALTHEEKLSVFEQIASKPTREAQRITLSLSSAPEIAKPDRVKPISAEHIEMKFTAKYEVQEKANRLKGWLAHQNPDMTMGELFDKLCDLGLSEWNPAKTAALRKRQTKTKTKTKTKAKTETRAMTINEKQNKINSMTGSGSEAQPTIEAMWDATFEAEPISTVDVKPTVKPKSRTCQNMTSKTEKQSEVQSEFNLEMGEEVRLGRQVELTPEVEAKVKSKAERKGKIESESNPKLKAKPNAKSTSASTLSFNLRANGRSKSTIRFAAKSKTQPDCKSNAQIRRDVFARANNQCENCHSSYALEIDHIQPQALGGSSTADNLRVLCRSCNQRAAIKALGLGKMEQYLN